MSDSKLAILGCGLVTSVGMTAAATSAAIRAKITNPTETRFIDSSGDWIQAHQVPLEKPWRGLTKLTKMAAMAIEEAMLGIQKRDWPSVPLLLCTAEAERHGRIDGLDDQLFTKIENEIGTHFAPQSGLVARGKVSAAVALAQARALIQQGGLTNVLVAATDSLLTWQTLSHYERNDRLLTARNSNGFMAGEGAGALLVGKASVRPGLRLDGFGFSVENAHIDSTEPLRGDGLTQAVKAALVDANAELHEMDCRITDLSGEQYYFKEASLALNRTLSQRKGHLDLWHPAESIGETGAVSGVACFAMGYAAALKGYAPGPKTIFHFSNDQGARAAVVSNAG